MNNGTQFIVDTIYSLKNDYGYSIIIWKILTSVPDIETGEVVTTTTYKVINKAVLLPFTLARKLFTKGVEYDINSRVVLIDNNDLDDFIISIDDYITFNGKKYIVNEVTTYDFNLATIVFIKESLGSIPTTIVELESSLELEIEIEDVVE